MRNNDILLRIKKSLTDRKYEMFNKFLSSQYKKPGCQIVENCYDDCLQIIENIFNGDVDSMISANEANELYKTYLREQYGKHNIENFIQFLEEEIKEAASNGSTSLVLTDQYIKNVCMANNFNVDGHLICVKITPIIKKHGYKVSYEEWFDSDNETKYKITIRWDMDNGKL